MYFDNTWNAHTQKQNVQRMQNSLHALKQVSLRQIVALMRTRFRQMVCPVPNVKGSVVVSLAIRRPAAT